MGFCCYFGDFIWFTGFVAKLVICRVINCVVHN
jgi:hypothetical protein